MGGPFVFASRARADRLVSAAALVLAGFAPVEPSAPAANAPPEEPPVVTIDAERTAMDAPYARALHASAAPDPRPAVAATGRVLTFRLRSGTTPPDGRPNAWVYVPRAFDPARPLHVTVLFRGFKNCIRSYVSADGKRCRPGGKIRTGYDVPEQVERSGTSSLVVVPELAYDEPSSDPGKLGDPGGLRAFLTELVEQALAPDLGAHRFADVERVALMASSGGYQALLPALAHGGVEAVRDVYLLDALYVDAPALNAFVEGHLGDFRPDAERPARFAMIYCHHGSGTRKESVGFGARAVARMVEAGLGSWAATGEDAEGAPDAVLRAPVVVLGTTRMHDTIVRDYLWKLLAASGI